jgi:transposase InsO family protein
MVIMDRFSSFTHLVPCTKSITAVDAFEAFQRTIIDTQGQPLSIVVDQDPRFTSRFWQQAMKTLNIAQYMAAVGHHQTNGQVERRIRTLKTMMRDVVNKRQNNWAPALPKIAASLNGAPHESLGMSPFQVVYGRPWKMFPPMMKTASQVPSADEIINNHEATRMEAELARNKAIFRQTVTANRRRKPQVIPWTIGTRVLVNGKPYASTPGRSRKLEPRWFGPYKVITHDPSTGNYKLDLPKKMHRQSPWFHVSSLKKYNENDPQRFEARHMNQPKPLLIEDNEEWIVEEILDYRIQNNRHEFLVKWEGYERTENTWEPAENLENAQDLVQEYWNTNHSEEPMPNITSHFVKATWTPMAVSATPFAQEKVPKEFWEPLEDSEYDSDGPDYFCPNQQDEEPLWFQVNQEDTEEWEWEDY